MSRRIVLYSLFVIFAGVLGAQASSWVAEPVTLPEAAEDFRLPDIYAPSGNEYYVPHDGGVLVPIASDAGSRIYFLKDGKGEFVKFPDGELEYSKFTRCLATSLGTYAWFFTAGLDKLVCRVEGARLVPVSDESGENLVVRDVWFPQGGTVPVISFTREADTMETLCVLRDNVATPLKDSEGNVLKAWGWADVHGTADRFRIVDVPNGSYEKDARTFRLHGDTATELDIEPTPPKPPERADSEDRCFRTIIDGQSVVYAWNTMGTECRFWLEKDGKAEWFSDDAGAIKHGFSQIAFSVDGVFAVGATGDEATPIAYRFTGVGAESLTWPEGADPATVKLEVHAGDAFLYGKVGEARRFWRLIGNAFKPVLTSAGAVFEVHSGVAFLTAAGKHVYITLGFMGPKVMALLVGAELVPIIKEPQVAMTFPDRCRVMALGDDVIVAWSETDDEGNEVNHISLVRPDGRLDAIRPEEAPFPSGYGVFVETETGIYAQFGAGGAYWVYSRAK